MNGRIYDPLIGRFMSADPYIQDASDLQSYNRYSYVRNNPMNLTDPSGYNWLSKTWKKVWASPIFKAVVGIVVAVVAPYLLAPLLTMGSFASVVVTGALSGFASTGTLKGALTGAFTAGLMYGAGTIAGDLASSGGDVAKSAFGDGGIGKIALHAGAGCLSGMAGGGSCKSDAIGAALGEFGHNIDAGSGMAAGITKSAMMGGIGSKLAGGKFADGVTTGAFGYLFNFLAHAHVDAQGNRTYGIDLAKNPEAGYLQDEKGGTIASRLGRGFKQLAEVISGLDGQGYGTRDLDGGISVKRDAYKMDTRMGEIMESSGVKTSRSGLDANMSETQMKEMINKFATDPQIGRQFRSTYFSNGSSTNDLIDTVNKRAGGWGLRP